MQHSSLQHALEWDQMPVELIGIILSHVACAHDVAKASSTCHKWRDAATHHIYKLAFDFSHWQNRALGSERRMWKEYEVIITKAVMRRPRLRELSVCNVRVHAAPLNAWLLHTKQTLKSFTFLPTFMTRVNVLEKLASNGVALECLVWGRAYMPTLNPAIHSLPSLASLTLNKVDAGLRTFDDLQLLFSLFPKLEWLSLDHICFQDAPSTLDLNIPPSLKTLNIKRLIFDCSIKLALHANSLESLSVIASSPLEIEHVDSLQHLVIQSVWVSRLQLGSTLRHLEVCNAHITHLEVGKLSSLLTLKLREEQNFTTVWLKDSQIISRASTKLSKLQVLGGYGPRIAANVDVDMLVSSFPCLRVLSLDYQHAFLRDPPQELQVLEHVVDLELYTYDEIFDHNHFGQWIVKLLERCPNAKRLAVAPPHLPIHMEGDSKKYYFVDETLSFLCHLMRQYPHIDVRFDLEAST